MNQYPEANTVVSAANAFQIWKQCNLQFYKELHKFNCFRIGEDGCSLFLELKNGMSMPHADLVRMLQGKREAATWIAIYMASRTVFEGPRVFRPSIADCVAMENINPNISLNEYVQPYPVMVVEYPREYSEKRIVVGESITSATLVRYRPIMTMITCNRDKDGNVGSIWTSTITSSGAELTQGLSKEYHSDISKGLNVLVSETNSWSPDTIYTMDEKKLGLNCARIAINSMLLMSMFGCKPAGTDNDRYLARLERQLSKQKDRKKAADLRTEIKSIPRIYSLDQSIKLRKTERSKNDHEPTGRIVSPHWRRGHIRMQACGPNASEHKKIFIAPVLVNAHLFGGDWSDTQVTYR